MGELKLIFDSHTAVESYDASEKFFSCMMEENSSVSEHVLKMSGYADKLISLGITIPNKLGIHWVLQSLPPSFKGFVMNYNMQGIRKSLPELLSMLKTAEVEIKKEHQVLMVNKTTSFKKGRKDNKSKGRNKRDGKSVAGSERKPKAGPKPETECFYCKEMGTGSATAQSIWRIRRTGRLTKVYMIYMLLMCTLLVVAIAPGYLIPVRLLTYVTLNRG